MDWDILAVDFGTTSTAAVLRSRGMNVQVALDGHSRMSSAVFRASDGALVAGAVAENQALSDLLSFVPAPKRLVGRGSVRVGDSWITDVDLVAAVLGTVVDEVSRLRNGNLELDAWLTFPAVWGKVKRNVLLEAAQAAGLTQVRLVSEPVAAATYYSVQDVAVFGVPRPVCVYDLGGGTFDVAILQLNETGQFEVRGLPSGIDPMGGMDFDNRLYGHAVAVLQSLDADFVASLGRPDDRKARAAMRDLRRQVTATKEALSKLSVATLSTMDGVSAQITQDEFIGLIVEDVDRTLGVVETTLEAAGVSADQLGAFYLIGGSSRIPFVRTRIAEQLHINGTTRDDPKLVVALGAAEYGAQQLEAASPVNVILADDAGSSSATVREPRVFPTQISAQLPPGWNYNQTFVLTAPDGTNVRFSSEPVPADQDSAAYVDAHFSSLRNFQDFRQIGTVERFELPGLRRDAFIREYAWTSHDAVRTLQVYGARDGRGVVITASVLAAKYDEHRELLMRTLRSSSARDWPKSGTAYSPPGDPLGFVPDLAAEIPAGWSFQERYHLLQGPSGNAILSSEQLPPGLDARGYSKRTRKLSTPSLRPGIHWHDRGSPFPIRGLVRDGWILEYSWRSPDQPVHQLQLHGAHGSQGFAFTCTASEGAYAGLRPLFLDLFRSVLISPR